MTRERRCSAIERSVLGLPLGMQAKGEVLARAIRDDTHLTIEGNWRLVEALLLWVADVTVDNTIER